MAKIIPKPTKKRATATNKGPAQGAATKMTNPITVETIPPTKSRIPKVLSRPRSRAKNSSSSAKVSLSWAKFPPFPF